MGNNKNRITSPKLGYETFKMKWEHEKLKNGDLIKFKSGVKDENQKDIAGMDFLVSRFLFHDQKRVTIIAFARTNPMVTVRTDYKNIKLN